MPNAPEVWHHPIVTRRDAGEYVDSLRPEITGDTADDWAFWSWLGMFHLTDIIPAERRKRLSAEVETFVLDPELRRASHDLYRHYLLTSWRLLVQFGDRVGYLLEQDVTDVGDLFRLSTNSPSRFNSLAIPELIVRLYTNQGTSRRGHTRGRGGLRHLLRVLDQLERTYDVYGMTPEALIRILPPDFDRWMPVD